MGTGDTPPTPAELRALISHLLAGAAGGSEEGWSGRVGEVEALPIVFNPRCNWQVEPSGTWEEAEAIWKAVELVRHAHPYVRSPA